MDERQVSEEVVLANAQRGDGDAFEWLVRRYQDRVYNTIFRLCRNEADALDLTQATFLKAFEALPRFQGRARFYTWLFRIGVNVALSHRRKAGPPAANLEAAEPVSREAGPGAALEAGELEARVAGALQRLSAEFRAAVVLRDVEGMDYAEIAEVLGVPVGTVKSRIGRGRAILRTMLAGEESMP